MVKEGEMPEDPVKVAPNNYKTIFENERVRLLEYRGSPGDKAPMHYHPDIVAYAIRSGKFRFTTPEGQSFDAELAEGEAMFAPGGDHVSENTGTTDAHVLLVELK